MKDLPGISVVITTYNEEKRLPQCLDSVVTQDYPQDKIEIILVDDNSTDRTVEIAKEHTEKIYYSGKKFCEISRAMGIRKATKELIIFIDADNILPSTDYLKRAVDALMSEPDIVASYPWRFHYDRNDPPANRYCSLFGINDPFQWYTGAREHVSYMSEWDIAGSCDDRGDYCIVEFPKNKSLTLGAIGFLTKRELILDKSQGEFFFHSDVFNELLEQGHTKCAVVRQSVIHNHCDSIFVFLGKLSRNYDNFLRYGHLRGEIWAFKNKLKFVTSVLLMGTFIVPFYDSLRGFLRKPDLAWFLHPFYCFAVVALYSYKTILSKLT